MFKVLAPLFLMAMLASGVRAAAGSELGVLRQFYQSPVALSSGGMPDPTELKTIAPFLSIDLVELLADARAKEIRCAAALPKGVKPPVWEGGVFSGSTEGATHLLSVAPKPSKRGKIVSATLEYVDAKFPIGHRYRSSTWHVDAAMVKVTGRWVIDDLLYEDGFSLRAYLVKSRRTSCNGDGSARQ